MELKKIVRANNEVVTLWGEVDGKTVICQFGSDTETAKQLFEIYESGEHSAEVVDITQEIEPEA